MTGVDVDALDKLREAPERQCPWCMAASGEWCEDDCANPDRRCHPSYVAHYAAERGAYSDEDAALIVAAVNALPELLAEVRRGRALREAVERLCGAWDVTGVPDRAVVVGHILDVLAAVDGDDGA